MADREFTNVNGIKVCDQTARDNIPTKISQLENDAHYASQTYVNNKIAEASLSGGQVDLSGYVTKGTGNANQITFADGQTFQAKLDAGTLKGEKGDQGVQGPQGPAGANGADGQTPNITIGTVTTLGPGTNATAEITGATPNLTLNLGIPKGADGTGGTGTGGTIETYGIIADGVTDNSNAIKTALRSTKYLILPSGKIYLASAIELESGTTITSLGDTEIITNGNPAFKCNGILNDSVTPNTVEFKHDITISNLTFTFNSEAETSALRFNSVNNVTVSNCRTTNISLITLSTAYAASELTNPDHDTVAAGGIVNEDCLSNNIKICDNTVYCTNGNTRTVGIVVCYCKNVIISRNIVRNAIDGVRIWGGNVGEGCYNRDEMEYYCKYITVSNNIVENTVGGIWAGRSAYVTFTGNSVNKCTDVGLDFEGSFSCTAVGNTVKDCINGCMGTMFSAKKISFIGNTCTDTGTLEQGTFMFVHSNNSELKSEVYFGYNTFTSKIRMLGSSLLDSKDGSIIIENNIFNNATIGLAQTAYTRIKNNSFWVDPTLSVDYWQKHDAPIINITLMSPGTNPEGLHRYNYEIIGNTFKNDTPTGLNDSNVPNKAISITGAAWRQSMRVLIKDNKMTGFNTCLAYKTTADNLNCETMLFIELINNLFSGDIINEGVNSYNRIFYEGNKKITENASPYIQSPSLSNYPNAIPVASTGNNAFWVKGTKIYFDEPDTDGYLGAICTENGNPGTWRRFGKIS